MAEVAIIDILRNNATVGTLVGGIGTSSRIYPLERPQRSTLPAITVRSRENDPYDTKSGASKLDDQYVDVYYYASTFSKCRQLAIASRLAVDRASGTYNGVEIQSIRYEDQDSWTEEIDNNLIYVTEHNYKARVIR